MASPYRFMGLVTRSGRDVPAMEQTRREVAALETTYAFEAAGIELVLRFTTPTLPDDIELLGRPVTFVDITTRSMDGKAHSVETYLDWSSNWAIGTPETKVMWGRHRAGDVEAMFVGAAVQTPLHRSGDEVQIDWGYLLLSAEPGSGTISAFGDALTLREGFAASGSIPLRDDVRAERPLAMPATGHRGPNLRADGIHQDRQNYNVSAWCKPAETVSAEPRSWRMLIAYDQVFAIDYFHRHLQPFWKRNGQSAIGLIETAWAERAELCARATAFGDELQAKLTASGGDVYARTGLLAFRQTLAGHALVANADGKLLYFSKENGSNGCLGTVDLTYPSAPFFLYFAPHLLEAQMRPICEYAASGRWPFPYAPHDVGQFPLANGQVYGGGELTERNQMPYEESGNMLILAAALAEETGSDAFAREFWPLLETWAKYLVDSGIDPDNQLCTDDFAGHLPHNANLSLKAIIGIAAFGLLCGRLGKAEEAKRHADIAKQWAAQWPALAGDGGHVPACLRPAGHVEPEVQSDLGPHPRARAVSCGDRRAGNGALQSQCRSLRAAAGQPLALYQARLALLVGMPHRPARGFRRRGGAGCRLARRHAGSRAAVGLVRHQYRQADRCRRLPREAGRRRHLHQAAAGSRIAPGGLGLAPSAPVVASRPRTSVPDRPASRCSTCVSERILSIGCATRSCADNWTPELGQWHQSVLLCGRLCQKARTCRCSPGASMSASIVPCRDHRSSGPGTKHHSSPG
jgi:hypothetical protein